MGKPRRLQVAVIGPGRLGTACARALLDDEDLALAGIVRRTDATGELPADLRRHPVATHVRELPQVDAALVCVPAQQVAGVARELLQARIPVVECAALEGRELELHHAGFDELCQRYRATAVVGAGWNPGLLTLMQRAFQTLIPRGNEVQHRHPGLALHHSAAAEQVAGVAEALEGEVQGPDGLPQRYVYLRLQPRADFERVRAAILADPLHAAETTQVFELDDLQALESGNGQGIALERRATAASGSHASLVFEARCEPADFAARVMLDAARRLPALPHRAHRYALGL
jgi:diaminopimelate dehydrogenase